MACDCKKQCTAGSCLCIDNGMKCTESCKLEECRNKADVDVNVSDLEESDEDETDEEDETNEVDDEDIVY